MSGLLTEKQIAEADKRAADLHGSPRDMPSEHYSEQAPGDPVDSTHPPGGEPGGGGIGTDEFERLMEQTSPGREDPTPFSPGGKSPGEDPGEDPGENRKHRSIPVGDFDQDTADIIAISSDAAISSALGWIAKKPPERYNASERQVEKISKALKIWISTLDNKMTPGQALGYAYGVTYLPYLLMALGDRTIEKRVTKQQKEIHELKNEIQDLKKNR